MLFWSRTPPNGEIEPRGHLAKVFERPTFVGAARKRMEDGEVLPRSRRDCNARNSFRRRRQRGEKREGKMAHGVAEFGPVRPEPGIDGIERFQLRDAGAFDHGE